MLENELLDGDQLLAFQKGLEAKKQENILFVIAVLIALGLYFLGVVNLFNLLIGLFFGALSFIFTSIKLYFIYYYIWENQTLVLFTMNRFGKKGQVSFQKNAIKKIRTSYFFLNKQGSLKITKHTQDKDQDFILLKTITKEEIQAVIKEIES
jgi:hypothetical protein